MPIPERVEIQRLYGVRHGAIDTDYWGDQIEVLVGPSKGLMKDLLTLPQGTRIGIEYDPELELPMEVNGQHVEFSEVDRFYWGRVRRLAQRNSLDIQYLDNIAFYARQIEKDLEARALFKKGAHKNGMDLNTHLRYMRASHKAEIEADYIYRIEREDAILDRITELKPAVVIVGQSHGDSFTERLEELRARGVIVGAYLAEDSTLPRLPYKRPLYERAILNDHPTPKRELVIERELVMRKYRAATRGRVMAEGIPDFIGTWDLRVPAKGLFEVYLESDGDGRIEDIFGSATAIARIDGDKIGFDKKYVLEDSSPTVIQETLRYTTDNYDDGKYSGTWSCEMGTSAFTMVPFKTGIDVNKALGLTF